MVLHYIRYSVSDPIWCEGFNKYRDVYVCMCVCVCGTCGSPVADSGGG